MTTIYRVTWALLSAVPRMGRRRRGATDGEARLRLEGDPPSMINPPPDCRFSTRCHLVRDDGTVPHRPF